MIYLVGMKEEFDKTKPLNYILKWMLIIGGTLGIIAYFEIPDQFAPFILIIVILITVNYSQSNELQHYKDRCEELKENAKEKKK